MNKDEFNETVVKEQELSLSIDELSKIGLRRKWFIITPFIFVMSMAILLCFHLPKVYKATTTIIVAHQILSNDYIKSPLATEPSAYMNVLEEEIKSRTLLEKIINELGLFQDVLGIVPMEILVDRMRQRIGLTISKAAQRNQGITSFSLSYLGKDPETVKSVTNRIVSLFIENQFKTRGEHAEKATAFISSELEETKTELTKQEKLLTKFKKRNQQNLPEQRDSNLRILENLITQFQKTTEQLDSAKNRKILLQQQMVQSEAIPFLTGKQDGISALLSPQQSRFNRLADKLIDLQTKYSDQHPEVIKTKREIEKLQRLIEKEDPEEKSTDTFIHPLSRQINQQLLAVNLEIEHFNKEEKKIGQTIKEYQMRIEKSPQTEQKLSALTDNYENTRETYEILLQKKMEAEQSEKLENKYQEEQFKILDPARVPEIPFKPNKRKVLLIGFMLALISGLGTAFLVETLDKSFYRVRDVESYLDVPVLISIPTIELTNKSSTAL